MSLLTVTVPVPEREAGVVVGGDAAGGGGEGAEEFAVEEDCAAEGKIRAFDNDGFVLISLVLSGEACADRGKPTARAAMGTDCLARSVFGFSQSDMNLMLASETTCRHEAICAYVACYVK